MGSGTFQLRTDLIAGQGDKLIINNSSAGNHTLIINNQGDVNTDGTEKLTVVETGDGGAKFALGNAVEIGAFEYGLQRTKVNPPTATWTAPPTTYQIASKSNSIATTPC